MSISPRPAEVTPEEAAARRSSARRTALMLGLVAVAIYVAFILSGVFGATGMKT